MSFGRLSLHTAATTTFEQHKSNHRSPTDLNPNSWRWLPGPGWAGFWPPLALFTFHARFAHHPPDHWSFLPQICRWLSHLRAIAHALSFTWMLFPSSFPSLRSSLKFHFLKRPSLMTLTEHPPTHTHTLVTPCTGSPQPVRLGASVCC